MRPMGKEHRIVKQEGAVLVAPDKIDQEAVNRIRTVGNPAAFTVGNHQSIPETLLGFWLAIFDSGPDAVLLKSMLFQCVGLLAEVVNLPLATDSGGVSCLAQQPGKGCKAICP